MNLEVTETWDPFVDGILWLIRKYLQLIYKIPACGIHEKESPKLCFQLENITKDKILHDFRLEGKSSLTHCWEDIRKYKFEDVVSDRKN